jgi:hypothetical protein
MYVEQKTEGESVISIQAIIVASKSGIPLFEDRFEDFSLDSNLVAGVSTALTTYIDEFMAIQKEGVETISKGGLTITSSKTEISTIVVISLFDLIPEVIQYLQRAQQTLEEYYSDKFSGIDRSRELMDPRTVYQICDNSGFKIGLKKLLSIHEDNTVAIKEDRTIGPTLRFHLGSLRELIPKTQEAPDGTKVINISSIIEHYKNRNLDDRMIGNLLILAYENKLLNFTLF